MALSDRCLELADDLARAILAESDSIEDDASVAIVLDAMYSLAKYVAIKDHAPPLTSTELERYQTRCVINSLLDSDDADQGVKVIAWLTMIDERVKVGLDALCSEISSGENLFAQMKDEVVFELGRRALAAQKMAAKT